MLDRPALAAAEAETAANALVYDLRSVPDDNDLAGTGYLAGKIAARFAHAAADLLEHFVAESGGFGVDDMHDALAALVAALPRTVTDRIADGDLAAFAA